jgi:hypothetical protein
MDPNEDIRGRKVSTAMGRTRQGGRGVHRRRERRARLIGRSGDILRAASYLVPVDAITAGHRVTVNSMVDRMSEGAQLERVPATWIS